MSLFICAHIPRLIKNKDLYSIFRNEYILNNFEFKSKPVMYRIFPKYNDYEHIFIHLTTISRDNPKFINDRITDNKRAERLLWVKSIIVNYDCSKTCINCTKIKYYEHLYKNKVRINLIFFEYRFKIILEQRGEYYLLITAYYIYYENVLKKEYKRLNKYLEQKTPI